MTVSAAVVWLVLLSVIVGMALGALLGWLAATKQLLTTPAPQPQPDAAIRDQQLHASMLNSLHSAVAPLERAVEALRSQVHSADVEQASSTAALQSQIHSLTRTSLKVSHRAENLLSALRSPTVRGNWGEVQLERAVELGGMSKYVDFSPQVSAYIDGKLVTPDLLIHLSGGRTIIVDAKVPYEAYLDAIDNPDPDEQLELLAAHAAALRRHIVQLSSKGYQRAFDQTPEFVVLFVPTDAILDAALSADATLLDFSLGRNIVLATPSSLFVLLRTIALSWQQDSVSTRAREVQRLGRELYQRIHKVEEHFAKVGQQLDHAVEAYNASLASIHSRLEVTARKLAELDLGGVAYDAAGSGSSGSSGIGRGGIGSGGISSSGIGSGGSGSGGSGIGSGGSNGNSTTGSAGTGFGTGFGAGSSGIGSSGIGSSGIGGRNSTPTAITRRTTTPHPKTAAAPDDAAAEGEFGLGER